MEHYKEKCEQLLLERYEIERERDKAVQAELLQKIRELEEKIKLLGQK